MSNNLFFHFPKNHIDGRIQENNNTEENEHSISIRTDKNNGYYQNYEIFIDGKETVAGYKNFLVIVVESIRNFYWVFAYEIRNIFVDEGIKG